MNIGRKHKNSYDDHAYAFGNALGNSIVEGMSTESDYGLEEQIAASDEVNKLVNLDKLNDISDPMNKVSGNTSNAIAQDLAPRSDAMQKANEVVSNNLFDRDNAYRNSANMNLFGLSTALNYERQQMVDKDFATIKANAQTRSIDSAQRQAMYRDRMQTINLGRPNGIMDMNDPATRLAFAQSQGRKTTAELNEVALDIVSSPLYLMGGAPIVQSGLKIMKAGALGMIKTTSKRGLIGNASKVYAGYEITKTGLDVISLGVATDRVSVAKGLIVAPQMFLVVISP